MGRWGRACIQRSADSKTGCRRGTAGAAIRIWHDQPLFKQKFGNATGWRLDVPHWSFSSRDASIWVAFDDATLENGCLYYLPGTHKTARDDNVGIGQNQADLSSTTRNGSRSNPSPPPRKPVRSSSTTD